MSSYTFLFLRTLYKNKAEIDKKNQNKLGTFWRWEVQKRKINITRICISFKNLLKKHDLLKACYLNCVKARIKHRKLRLICRESHVLLQDPFHEKCPFSEFFQSVFSRIRTEYGDLLRKSPYSVRMRENTDQKNTEYGYFLRSHYANSTRRKELHAQGFVQTL